MTEPALRTLSLPVGDEEYQLYHEDCFGIMPKLPAASVDLVLADLPYGTTACKWDSTLPLPDLWREYERLLKPGGLVVLTAAQPFTWRLCASNPEDFRYELIWEKPNGTNPMLVKKQPFRNHENILVFYKKQPTYNPQMITGEKPYGGFESTDKKLGEAYGENNVSRHRDNPEGTRYPKSVQRFAQERGGHPTQKPVALMEWLIRTYSNPGDLVLDNCMGSGTTGVACRRTGRKFIGIEKERKYFDMATQRIQEALL